MTVTVSISYGSPGITWDIPKQRGTDPYEAKLAQQDAGKSETDIIQDFLSTPVGKAMQSDATTLESVPEEAMKFGTFVGQLLERMYHGNLSQADFNDTMNEYIKNYAKLGFDDEVKLVKAASKMMKEANWDTAADLIWYDPARQKKFDEFVSDLLRKAKEGDKGSGVVPVYVDPIVVKKFNQIQHMVNQWANDWAVENGVNVSLVKTDNPDYGWWGTQSNYDASDDFKGKVIDTKI